jgi:DNA-binding CsgD family transcriptional regulator
MLTGVAPECHSRRTDKERTEHMAPTGSGEITPRDIQVVKWIACGMERDDVAKTLNTSRSAVNRHMAKVMKLTATPSGTAAVAHVMALGLLRAQDVTSLTMEERSKRRLLLAPDVVKYERSPGTDVTRVEAVDVATWLRSNQPTDPAGDEMDHHVYGVLETLAVEIESGGARIPSPRRDPDAPRPPQQPERDDR